MIEIHLYGKLRTHAPDKRPDAESIVELPPKGGDTVGTILERLGITPQDTSNIFLNGELCLLSREIHDGDRLGIFPDDMALLYKWYFKKRG